jgi:2-polyprenyl-3-methyl-5-hydroxy-6-metoxy-1,4-benzoquinol methylase
MPPALLSRLTRPVRFDYIDRHRPAGGAIRILDVGCGNHSASVTKASYPAAEYHGLDIDPSYNNDDADHTAMDRFFPINLEEDDLEGVPGGYYDVVILSHVIEHLRDGLGVLGRLVTKLRPGGIIYVETPHPRSLHLPSMKGSLNFHDDDSHVRVYTQEEITAGLTASGCRILQAGTRRSLKRMVMTPVHCLNSLIRDGYVAGSAFWDILGFAAVVVARRGPGL